MGRVRAGKIRGRAKAVGVFCVVLSVTSLLFSFFLSMGDGVREGCGRDGEMGEGRTGDMVWRATYEWHLAVAYTFSSTSPLTRGVGA